MKPLKRISCEWTPDLAYAIGLITTDGCLYKDGRHLAFVSKDYVLVLLFKKILGLKNKIAKKRSGFIPSSYGYWIQFGDVNFYKFLVSIGLTPAKSKILGKLGVPDEFFFDFLRGHFDGDGSFYSYWDKRWASSFMFYLSFTSASIRHLKWLQGRLQYLLGIKGHLDLAAKSGAFQLKYAKAEALVVSQRIYYREGIPRLERKYRKVYTALEVNAKNP